MEGVLLVPPDRGVIIGRALWKPRFVVVGDSKREYPMPSNPALASHVLTRALPLRSLPSGSGRASPSLDSPMLFSIFKHKNDWDAIEQYAITSITDCQVQMVAHRKQGPALPTLVVVVAPDPVADKMRKRRSSRTASLSNHRDNTGTTLWFRAGDDVYSLQDWCNCIQALITANASGPAAPMSPTTPSSPIFANPFSPRTRDSSDRHSRPGSGNATSRSTLSHKTSTQTYSSRERPVTFSESPSLRSMRSDISHVSSMNPSQQGFFTTQKFTSSHTMEIPSPATTVNEVQGEFSEEWAAAQGRSTAMSSPARGRESISSQATSSRPMIGPSSPPGPRETILDRAFQLRCIPGTESTIPGEEKLSSLARFDALMRDVTQRRKTSIAAPTTEGPVEGLKSAWDLDESEESGRSTSEEDDTADLAGRAAGSPVHMPPTAQRALDFIASRHESGPPTRVQSPVDTLQQNTEALQALNSGYPSLGPNAGFTKRAAHDTQRTHSPPHLSADVNIADLALADNGDFFPKTAKRSSSTSTSKRLSFNDFTKRLSSTSSLLLVQSNISGASSRGSSEQDPLQNARVGLKPRGAAPSSPSAEREVCKWQSSLGVLADGPFL